MQAPKYLFPHRFTRRDFLRVGALSATALAAVPYARGEDATVKIGSGKWTYTLDPAWGKLPDGMKFGLGCGIVVDGKGRIVVTSRSNNPCVAIFDKSGMLLDAWSNEFAEKLGYPSVQQVTATAHCIYWSKEGNDEFFYFTENIASGGKNEDGTPKAKIGARVYKTDLQGKILHTIGNVAAEDAAHQKFDWTNPTDVAVAPNGDIYVVDGYGSQRVSRFDKHWKHLKTFGGKGKTNDTFNICHGIWVDTRKTTPEIYIADRANGRLQVYDLELNYKRTIAGDFVRNPCCFYQHADHLYVPDLGAMLTIFDKEDKPVAVLGDGKPVLGGKRATAEMEGRNPEVFFAPHALTIDSEGSIYVVEWVPWGRVRKFRHTPA